MNGDTDPSPHVPQLRALLFTDLCDSTSLVERIGDTAAADLFQQHDRLVLAMQQRWRGQQIDRSDGLFLLFERPVDALGFALDYQQALRQLGQGSAIALSARAGLHVGEVILWNNSAEAIALGSKPVEVEGLAKPMAARLMQLARPGQILLSATAESMVRRAASTLGALGDGLAWRSFGRWRFKGVPQPMDVYGVASPVVPAVRAPRATSKARRDVPFWRRPAAVAAELTFAMALVVGVWLLTRPQPAIAFVERDWVVVGDVRNLTGNVLLDDSLDQAFRISLEQSRFVNVLGDLKVRDTLARMRRAEGTPLDRKAAIEVALRDGAKAVVLPSVMEVHDKLRVAVEVVDPATSQTIYSEFADGRGLDSALASTDRVVAALRGRLGESPRALQRDASPLPQVTTSNLDALRAYSLGVSAYAGHRHGEALDFFNQAARIDPEFAFAYMGSLRVHYSRGDYASALADFRKASSLRNQLPTRDALYLDAWGEEFQGSPLPEVARRWKLLADMYPDYFAGRVNYANTLFHMGNYRQALAASPPLLTAQNPAYAMSLDFVGRLHLARSDYEQAMFYFRASTQTGTWKASRQMAAAYAATGDREAAERILVALPDELPTRIERITLKASRADWVGATKLAADAVDRCGDTAMICDLFKLIALNVQSAAGKVPPASSFDALAARSSAASSGMDRESQLYIAAAAVYLAQRSGHVGVAAKRLPAIRALASTLQDRRCNELVDIIEATTMRSRGQARQAIPLLKRWVDGGEQYQLHVALRDAYATLGDTGAQSTETAWLARNRGLAYAENAGSYVMQARNVLDSGPLLRSGPGSDQPAASTKQ